MSSQIDVQCEALSELHAAFGRFAGTAPEVLARMRTELQWRLAEVERRRAAQRSEVERLQALCDSAGSANDESEEATEDYSGELEAAEERLAEITAAVRQVEQAVMKLDTVAARAEALLTDRTHSACAFLQGKLEQLAAYRSAQLSGGGGAATAIGSVGARAAAAPALASGPQVGTSGKTFESAEPELSTFRLPAGFQWVPLDRIALADELRDVEAPEAFQKTVYEVMRRGFETLRREVLPAIAAHGVSGTADRLRQQDSAAGTPSEESLQCVYESFFGSDPIYLDRGASPAGLSVMSGRHRLKVARDLGWRAVPARISPRVRL